MLMLQLGVDKAKLTEHEQRELIEVVTAHNEARAPDHHMQPMPRLMASLRSEVRACASVVCMMSKPDSNIAAGERRGAIVTSQRTPPGCSPSNSKFLG